MDKFNELKDELRKALAKIVEETVTKAFENDFVKTIDVAAAKADFDVDDEVDSTREYITDDEAYEEIREKAEIWAESVGDLLTKKIGDSFDDWILGMKHYVPTSAIHCDNGVYDD
jgi:hypothetical protein